MTARGGACYGAAPMTRTTTVAAVVMVLAGVAYAEDRPSGTTDPERLEAEIDVIADAAVLGDALAQFMLAIWLYEVPESADTVVFWCRLAADQGLAMAQAMLGSMYSHGFGAIEPDAVEAAHWYRLAADQGMASTQHDLGLMYVRGDGVPEDAAEAAHWTRLAAEQGQTEAQVRLGAMYGTGEGVPLDYVMSYAWLNVAAVRDEKAGEMRDMAGKLMTAEQLAEGQRLARVLWERAEAAKRAAPDPLTVQTPAPSGSARELRATVQAALDSMSADTHGAP